MDAPASSRYADSRAGAWGAWISGAILAVLVFSGAPGGGGGGLRAAQSPEGTAAAETPRGAPHASLEDLEGMACTECHDELLEGKIQHPPAAEQECETCHEISPTGDAASVSLTEPVAELCVICHGTVEEELARPYVHGAVKALGCTGCHNPHSSGFPRLLRVQSNALCQACHLAAASPEAREEGAGLVLFGSHPVPATFLDSFPKIQMRTQDGRGHPVAKHPVRADSNPLRPGEPFGCSSCHEPHAASRKALLVGSEAGSFCRPCHQK